MGVAIVIVNHLRTVDTMLHDILPQHTVITVFLRSLTENWDGKLIAVIVSGYDGDGAEALGGIKEVGGITIAQKLDTAKQSDMPESAIASGYIDFIHSPENIAKEIIRISETI